MTGLSAAHIVRLSGGDPSGVPGLEASGVSFHTGRLRPGDAFFALPGERTHGLAFADEALARGAAFIVSDRPHPRSVTVAHPTEALLALGRWARAQYRGEVIGVTGSAGKTSTKTFLAAALNAPSSPGNLNTPLALAAILTNQTLAQTRPEPLILELGIDHVGEMATLAELVRPSHGLLTLVAPSHLAGLGRVETVASEKATLLEAAETRFASLQAAGFLTPELRATTLTYGLAPDAAEHTGQVTRESGTNQTLIYKEVQLDLAYPGRAMALNALAALVVADTLGVDLAAAAERLAAAKLEAGRLERKSLGRATVLDDSYNSNPASARAALEVLRSLPGPHTAILGDMLELGPDAPDYHRELGRATVGLARVVAIGDMAHYLAEGNPAAEPVASFGEALPILANLPLEGTLLIKGSRGMRLERVLEVLAQQTAPV